MSETDLIPVNLEKIISEMVLECSEISEVYLFGSRAYKTNSRRSDFDLIVFCKTWESLDIRKLKMFREKYGYLDIFVGNKYGITSICNNSSIAKREKKLIKQLDAILLWNQKGFAKKNKSFLTQEIIRGYYLPPSELNNNDPLHHLYKFENVYTSRLDIKKRTYLENASRAYNSFSILGFIAIIGSFFERSLIDLFESYNNRVLTKFSSAIQNIYLSTVLNSNMGIKNRMDKFIDFVKTYDVDGRGKLVFYKNYFPGKSTNIIGTTFDFVRIYRNDVDHCLEYNYSLNDCRDILNLFKENVPSIYDAIEELNNNPSK